MERAIFYMVEEHETVGNEEFHLLEAIDRENTKIGSGTSVQSNGACFVEEELSMVEHEGERIQ